jgi:hypothetical protein
MELWVRFLVRAEELVISIDAEFRIGVCCTPSTGKKIGEKSVALHHEEATLPGVIIRMTRALGDSISTFPSPGSFASNHQPRSNPAASLCVFMSRSGRQVSLSDM